MCVSKCARSFLNKQDTTGNNKIYTSSSRSFRELADDLWSLSRAKHEDERRHDAIQRGFGCRGVVIVVIKHDVFGRGAEDRREPVQAVEEAFTSRCDARLDVPALSEKGETKLIGQIVFTASIFLVLLVGVDQASERAHLIEASAKFVACLSEAFLVVGAVDDEDHRLSTSVVSVTLDGVANPPRHNFNVLVLDHFNSLVYSPNLPQLQLVKHGRLSRSLQALDDQPFWRAFAHLAAHRETGRDNKNCVPNAGWECAFVLRACS